MGFTVNTAGAPIAIHFSGETEKAIPLCRYYFRGFIRSDTSKSAGLRVSILEKSVSSLPFQDIADGKVSERLLLNKEIFPWLRQLSHDEDDFPLLEDSIISFCLGGLLLFDPTRSEGRIYLLKQRYGYFRPLYRLLWLYSAQVLGEKGSCFIHGLALEKDNQGYLFLGDSGAGKSTLAGICNDCLIFSDDSPVFLKYNGGYNVLPSPYNQFPFEKDLDKESLKTGSPLKGMYFLKKDEYLKAEKISSKEALSMIIKRYIHFFSFLSVGAKIRLFDLFQEACKRLSSYRIHLCPNKNPLPFIDQISAGGEHDRFQK